MAVETVVTECHIGLTQSAILCIDVITRSISFSNSEWIENVLTALGSLLELAQTIYNELQAVSVSSLTQALSERYQGLMKLLGSVYLCCGTLARSAGPRTLTYLTVSSFGLSPTRPPNCSFGTLYPQNLP
jgi:hypothetical protein